MVMVPALLFVRRLQFAVPPTLLPVTVLILLPKAFPLAADGQRRFFSTLVRTVGRPWVPSSLRMSGPPLLREDPRSSAGAF